MPSDPESTNESGRLYPKLSPEAKDRFLRDFKQAIQCGSVKIPNRPRLVPSFAKHPPQIVPPENTNVSQARDARRGSEKEPNSMKGDSCKKLQAPLDGIGPEDPKVYPEASGAQPVSTYVALLEKTGTGHSAHVPDLPGCIAAAGSYGETVKLIREAIEFHIEGMLLHGERVPEPTTLVELIEVG